jgi:hypothetical protein
MNAFNRLPGFTQTPPGLEHAIWRRLPAVLLWGTLLPLVLAGLGHLFADEGSATAADGALLRWDFTMLGLVVLHWTVVFTLGLGCFIVRVMKGPAYVADPYPLPQPGVDQVQARGHAER